MNKLDLNKKKFHFSKRTNAPHKTIGICILHSLVKTTTTRHILFENVSSNYRTTILFNLKRTM